jgi:hypothetical protein
MRITIYSLQCYYRYYVLGLGNKIKLCKTCFAVRATFITSHCWTDAMQSLYLYC